ncbi:threonine/serine exporter family protein [Brevundimonas sp. Root1279]|uniref:threonine/serine exporter family protein n=1 Tax=Brevundimonas sp. Root1279 TaxID=1736443 RepID=UPI0006F606E3|nr:threonine/serine exporter family protein [Brevundimonas sp. Root1279]KQW86729.1 hypothetical protein ASC65_02255 [Brevundimonas sp. Root1279]
MRPIEIALDAALLVMRSGGSTPAAERSFANIIKAFRQDVESVVWRLDFIAATQKTEGKLATVVRPVGQIGINLYRASEVAVLGERAARGEVSPAEIETEVARIQHLRSPYRPWLTILVAAATAACFAQIPGTLDLGASAVAFTAAAVGQLVRIQLQGRGVTVAPITLICGLLSSLIGAGGLRLGFSQDQATVLLGSILYLVPGLPLINGFIDMISHRHLFIGMERMLNAAFLFLVVGLTIAIAHNLVLGGG